MSMSKLEVYKWYQKDLEQSKRLYKLVLDDPDRLIIKTIVSIFDPYKVDGSGGYVGSDYFDRAFAQAVTENWSNLYNQALAILEKQTEERKTLAKEEYLKLFNETLD